MASLGPDHVSLASGVNNAIARTASLAALAVVPVVSGLATATDAATVTDAFRTSLVIAAVLVAAASPIALVGLRPDTVTAPSSRRSHCAVAGPPLQPDPARCPVVTSR
jgi:hypothetical protein